VIEVSVDPDLAMLLHQIKQSFPGLELSITALNDSIAIRGQVPSAQVAEQILEMASTFGKVHNFLETAGGQQVMLQVRYAEVSKSALRNLGVSFGGTDGVSSVTNAIGNGGTTFTGTSPGLGLATATGGSGITVFGQGRFGVVAFDYFISALRTNGLVKVLAEPNVMASSGKTASFLAGGQVPIPVPQPGNGGSTITIQYENYGVQLNFTPQILGNGKIRLEVAPEVSDLDYSVGVAVAGTTVPGFTDRKVNTTVELGDGQSFALAGLLNNKISATNTAIPLLGDIPILGALFTSTSYQRNETELVILVTPRLVAPMNPGQVPTLPGEKWRYPNQLQSYVFHDLGGPKVDSAKTRADSKTEGAPPQFHGSYGFTAVGSGSVAEQPQPAH
jgi:pilus assembly protein CpaC